MKNEIKDFMKIKQFLEIYPHVLSDGALRWIIFNWKTNGSNHFFRKLGKRILVISPQLFFEWLNTRKKEI